jgi:arylsulfatase A-like enzyme
MNFEGGINVPFLLRWPKPAAARGDLRRAGLRADVFMTAVRARGAALPSDRTVRRRRPRSVRERRARRRARTRRSTGAPRPSAIRVGTHKLISDAKTAARVLYDLEADPYENTDLSESDPALANRLEDQLAEVGVVALGRRSGRT